MVEASQVGLEPSGSLHNEVLETIQRSIREVVGEDFYEVYEIGLTSSFSEDLELESLEIVEIAERVMAVYPTVDFVTWASKMELEELVEITLADLVDFIVTSVEASGEHGEG